MYGSSNDRDSSLVTRKSFVASKIKFSGDGDAGKMVEWDRQVRGSLEEFNPAELRVFMDQEDAESGGSSHEDELVALASSQIERGLAQGLSQVLVGRFVRDALFRLAEKQEDSEGSEQVTDLGARLRLQCENQSSAGPSVHQLVGDRSLLMHLL